MSTRSVLRSLVRDSYPPGTRPDRIDVDHRADRLHAAIGDEALAKAGAVPVDVTELREQIKNTLSEAGAYCGDCSFEPGDRGNCLACEQTWESYATALLPLIVPAGLIAAATWLRGEYTGPGDDLVVRRAADRLVDRAHRIQPEASSR